MKIVKQSGGFKNALRDTPNATQGQLTVTAMQVSMQSNQFSDRRTGDQSHLLQVEREPATVEMIDQLIQFDTELFDVVLVAQTRSSHDRDCNRGRFLNRKVSWFEGLN